MKSFTLNYFKKWSKPTAEDHAMVDEDFLAKHSESPQVVNFKSYDKLVSYVLRECKSSRVVYLFGVENKEPFVTREITLLEWYMRNCLLISESSDFYLQEYWCYEDAYAVAKDMMEDHELCYDEE